MNPPTTATNETLLPVLDAVMRVQSVEYATGRVVVQGMPRTVEVRAARVDGSELRWFMVEREAPRVGDTFTVTARVGDDAPTVAIGQTALLAILDTADELADGNYTAERGADALRFLVHELDPNYCENGHAPGNCGCSVRPVSDSSTPE